MRVRSSQAHDVLEDQKDKISVSVRDDAHPEITIRPSGDLSSAITSVVVAYSMSSVMGTGDFARLYTYRPKASFEDIFGDPDLAYTYQEDVRYEKKLWSPSAPPVSRRGAWQVGFLLSRAGILKFYRYVKKVESYWKASGKEGFHSRALSNVDDVFVLVPKGVRKILGLSKGSEVLKRLDTRRQKREAVLALVEDLSHRMTLMEPEP